ncbi:MAG: hypothetical protein ACXABF_16970 [Candidatus Thorarchaeota archaeon]|jgi:peptide subunit release factor 1 (eRF1)
MDHNGDRTYNFVAEKRSIMKCPECGGKIKTNESYKELDDDIAEYKVSIRCRDCGFGAELTVTEVQVRNSSEVYRKLMQRLATEGAASEYSNN